MQTLTRFALLAGLGLSTPLAMAAPDTGTTASPDSPISIATLKRVDKKLASDAFGGRAPASEYETKSINYIRDQFKAAGLKPGNDGSWFQKVPLVQITSHNVAPLKFTGGSQPLSFDYRNDMVVATYQEQKHIDLNDSDVVFVGYGIDAPELGWNDYAGVDVKGKTVIILVNDPDWQNEDTEGRFEGKAMTYYGRWTYKYEEAARQGAAAALIVHQTKPAAYGWGVVQSSWTGPQMEAAADNHHADASQVIGWLQLPATKKLFAAAGKNFEDLEAAAQKPGFKAVPLDLQASVDFDNDIARKTSHNVIGVLPGTEHPEQTVFYSAHWDHLGHCDAVNGDSICNGAADNASGVAGVVALAEAQVAAGPADRSLVFMAPTAEESGLLGSAYYAAHPIYPLDKTVGGVNMDILNVNGASHDITLVGAGQSSLDELLKSAAQQDDRYVAAEPTPQDGFYFRSDQLSFARHGVPLLFTSTGTDLIDGGKKAGLAAKADYVANRYHKPQDEYDPNWDWQGAQADLELFYAVGRKLANSDIWPQWSESSQFHRPDDWAHAEDQ